jgi:hypothetical protein
MDLFSQDCCKCTFCGLNLLHILELSLGVRAVTTSIVPPSDHLITSTAPGAQLLSGDLPLGAQQLAGTASARTCPSALMMRKPCSKNSNDFWAKRFKSPTLEDSAMEKLLCFPLGNAT